MHNTHTHITHPAKTGAVLKWALRVLLANALTNCLMDASEIELSRRYFLCAACSKRKSSGSVSSALRYIYVWRDSFTWTIQRHDAFRFVFARRARQGIAEPLCWHCSTYMCDIVNSYEKWFSFIWDIRHFFFGVCAACLKRKSSGNVSGLQYTYVWHYLFMCVAYLFIWDMA